jgi:hypothetical protein
MLVRNPIVRSSRLSSNAGGLVGGC